MSDDVSPHPDCRSPIQAFLTTLPRAYEEQGPPGSMRATFVSSNADLRWEIRRNQETLCETPCTRWVDPLETLRLRAYQRGAPSDKGDTVDVPDLRAYSGGSGVRIEAEPTSNGALVGGIVTAGVGGMALFFGGFFALFGAMAEEDGMVTGGAVAAGVGVVAVGSGVVAIVMSGPDVELSPEYEHPSTRGRPLMLGVSRDF
jgi:hypothetical protein